MKPRLNTGLSI